MALAQNSEQSVRFPGLTDWNGLGYMGVWMAGQPDSKILGRALVK
jgi:hypothetical protein